MNVPDFVTTLKLYTWVLDDDPLMAMLPPDPGTGGLLALWVPQPGHHLGSHLLSGNLLISLLVPSMVLAPGRGLLKTFN